MVETEWYEKSYRRNLVDMHIEEWDQSFLSKFDPERYVANLKMAHVQTAMVYANSHVGYCYWPTKTGHVHRVVKGRDILGEVISLCHREGFDVIPYYSLIYNNWAYEQHPSWRILDVQGRGSRDEGGPDMRHGSRYGVCCPNNKDYRAFEESQIRELCETYEFEGIFFDMNFWPAVCYCPACRRRFSEEVGGDIPTVVEWSDDRWCTFQTKREQWLSEHALFASTTAKKHKPGISVEHNSATYPAHWKRGSTLGQLEANTYIGGDLYGGFLQQSFICKLYYSVTPNQPFEYMTSRCYPNIRDHTTTKSKEQLEMHALLALAHGGAFLFIDAINPNGTQDDRVYATMGEVFRNSARYEQYLGGRMCADVGIYFSLTSKMDFADNGKNVDNTQEDFDAEVPHRSAALGAARALKENHIPFGVISSNRLEQLSEHQVVVLPELLVLTTEEQAGIREYVENGGSVYASGQSAALLSDLFGVELEGEFKETISYIAPNDGAGSLMPGITPQAPLSIVGRQLKARASASAEVMANVVLPYTDPADPVQFSSIHSNPPGNPTDCPAVVSRSVGKGRVLWVAAPIEAVDKGPHKQAFVSIIRSLASKPFTFSAEAPPAVEVIAFYQPDKMRYLLSAVNEQELLPAVQATGVKIVLSVPGKRVKEVWLLPEEKKLNFDSGEESITIEIPTVNMMHMVMVDCK